MKCLNHYLGIKVPLFCYFSFMILQFSYYKKSKFKLIYYIINIHFRYIIYTKKKNTIFLH